MTKKELNDKELDAIAAAGAQGTDEAAETFRPVTPDDMPTQPSAESEKAFEEMRKAMEKLPTQL